MELRQLHYFITAARVGNLTKAAELHYVSQPNISVAIHKLEDELQTKLFQREYKKVTLTPAGRRFYEAVTAVLADLQRAVDEIQDEAGRDSGTITIGIPPMIGTFAVAPLTAYFRQTHPHWELIVVEDGSVGLLQRLRQKEIDLALAIIDNCDDELETTPLFHAEHCLCLPDTHRLAKLSAVPFTALRDEPLIMMRLDSFHRRRIFDECAAADFEPLIALSSNHIQSNIDSVAAGTGLSFLLNRVPLHRSDVVLRPVLPRLTVTVGIARLRRKYVSDIMKDCIRYFINTYQS